MGTPGGTQQKIDFSRNESPQQQYIKRTGKKLRAVVEEAIPGNSKQVHFAPRNRRALCGLAAQLQSLGAQAPNTTGCMA